MTDLTVERAGDTVDDTPILEARGIVKTYGHVQALQGADFVAYPGSV